MCDQPQRHQVPAVARELPGALILVHLKQHPMDTRVRAGGDESLDLHALARQVTFVSITIVRSDAASVPERWRGQVLHGVLGPTEYVVPEELPFGQGFIKLTQQEMRCVRRSVETRRARASSVRASYSAMMGWLGLPKARLKWSTQVDTRGDI